MNGDVQSDLATLEFKNREQLEDFHSIIIRLQKEIISSGETLSPTRLIFQYMNTLSKSDKLKAIVVPKMTDLITFLDKNEKIGCLHREKYAWTLFLSRNDWSPNYIDHFRSEISSFWSFIFHQQLYSNSPDSYCSSLHYTENHLQIMWKYWTQGWCLHHVWP